MTLLVVGIGVPTVAQSDLGEALREKKPEIVSFFVSFVVIGDYWLAHPRFSSRLGGITPRLMTINLTYLAAIAFVPFPTALAGKYTDEPISIVMYAITLGVTSGLEAVLSFFISIPIAFVHITWALLSWLLILPLEIIWDRRFEPDEAERPHRS